MDPVVAALRRAAETGLMPPGSRVLLAVSGGADSTALLHGAAALLPETGWTLSIGHVHHGLRGRDADRDLSFVADQARRLGLAFLSRFEDARHAARRLRLSPESAARHVRYAALRAMAAESGASRVATAHQSDDALESHWIARERRGGALGLAGPRERRDDGIVRPLLAVSRRDILGFLEARALPFRRDASNGDLRFARNRVRRELAALPQADRDALGREIRRCRERARRLEEALAAEILPTVLTAGPDGPVDADAARLQAAAEDVRRIALDRLAAPFARPGHAPMTGREREALVARLGSGLDFRFEAGRRIRFERRGDRLRVRPRPPDARAGRAV